MNDVSNGKGGGARASTPAEPLRTTLSRDTRLRLEAPHGAAGRACLLGLHPQEVRGRRYDLPDDGHVRVGRHPSNDILVPSGDVSRRHCTFERVDGRWQVVDDGSTNRTWVNDVPIDRAVLRSGDRVTLGGPIFRFFEGADVELELIEQASSLERLDGLTGFLNRKSLHIELEKALAEAGRVDEAVSVALFRVDDLEHLLDERVGLDGILREVAELARAAATPRDLLGHQEQSEFVWVMPGAAADEAGRRAEQLRRAVQAHRFRGGRERLPVTISLGVAQHRAHWDMPILVQQAASQLFSARQRGGNTVQVQLGSEPGVMRRPLEGRWLLRKVLAEEPPRALVAFEVEDEPALVDVLGPDAPRQWSFELQQVAIEHLPDDEYVGHWQQRYVLATHRSDDPDAITALAQAIDAAFTALGAPAAGLTRRARFAFLRSREVAAYGERSLDEVVRKLLARTGGTRPASQTIQRLPHPLAVPHLVVASRTSSLMRARALADGIEQYLRFLVAIELGWLRTRVGQEAVPGVVAALHRVDPTKRLSFGSWLRMAVHLARLFGPDARGLVPQVVEPFAARRGRGAQLQRRLDEAVQIRNGFTHRSRAAEDGYSVEETFLREVLGELTRIFGCLYKTRLVSVKGVEDVDGDTDEESRLITYLVREHRGPQELFTAARFPTEAAMIKGWCYLVVEEGRPLPLAPVYWSGVCSTCRREELFAAEGLWQGALRREAIELVGVTSNHAVKVELPLRSWEREVLDGWAAPRASHEPPPSLGTEEPGFDHDPEDDSQLLSRRGPGDVDAE